MAPKPRNQNSHRRQESKDIPRQQNRVTPINGERSTQETIQSSLKALELLILAAVCSPVSQLTLSPVYGSVPSAIHHQRLTMVTFLLAWILKNRIHTSVLLTMMGLLPVLATAIPTVQYFLFQLSGPLGPVYGPLITEVLTYSPLVFISVLGAAELFDAVDLSRYGEHVNHAGPGILSYAILNLAEKFSKSIIKQNIGSGLLFTRLGLQSVIGAFYTILFPSKFLLLAILPLLHTFSANIHSPLQQNTSALNSSLHAHNYSLVARHESLTGYISVLDNFNDGFRVMRCDHSLLGGEWFKHPRAAISALREPVYSVFVMLEAVRLVEVKSSKKQVAKPDKEKHALVIGLGVGTTPSALITHGINTTIVEIDPKVHDYATQYFGLPPDHISVIQDATIFVGDSEAAGSGRNRYDYIIHDVFTGGAEPADLFTAEFFQGLSSMLTTDGVIAINYAGDLLLPSASLIIRTVKSVFPACRFYREDAAPDKSEKPASDWTNMVMFCRKSKDYFSFREAVDADFLGSQTRRYELQPKHEINAALLDGKSNDGFPEISRRGNIKFIEALHQNSAVGHWKIMRTVLPDVIWQNW